MKNLFIKGFVSVFGLGYIPVAPGTFGTLGAFFMWAVFLRGISSFWYILITAFLIVLSFYIATLAERIYQSKDSQHIVIDEVCGYLVTMLFAGNSLLIGFLGFALFRLFDILKPWPVRRMEQLYGGAGVVMDDVMAGVYGFLVLRILSFFVG